MQSLSVQSPSVQESTGRAPAPFPLREVMARFATGVVVLSVGGEHIHGMTANAFSSVSLDPPTVLCCVAHDAVMHRAIRSAGHFGVSVLGAGQEALARYFADKKRPLGPEQFDGLEWTAGPVTEAPLLQGATAWLECELSDSHDSGDHSIFVGDVVGATRAEGDRASCSSRALSARSSPRSSRRGRDGRGRGSRERGHRGWAPVRRGAQRGARQGEGGVAGSRRHRRAHGRRPVARRSVRDRGPGLLRRGAALRARPRDRRDAALQAAMRRRGRQIVTGALAAARQPARRAPLPEEPSELASAHESLVRTLLLECAALTVCDKKRFPAGTVPPADLVRELGRSTRTARHAPRAA